jgi:ABC-2 type transport system permease protein
MKKIIQIAVREFVATVLTRAFIIGLLIMPALIALGVIFGPRLFNFRNFQLQGDVAVVDPTGRVAGELRKTLDARVIAARRAEGVKQALAQAPDTVRQLATSSGNAMGAAETALGPIPDVRLVERPPDADVQQEKSWLKAGQKGTKHLALIVVHPNAVVPAGSETLYGSYDLYVPPNLDDRVDAEIQESLREAIINARVSARSLDRQAIDAMVHLPRVRSITVTKENEQQTVMGFNMLLPAAFGALLFIGVLGGGQALLTSTVEEKSSRVMEVLLSAVSPMELMAGKLMGHMAVSLVGLALYISLGMVMLTSLSLLGLLDPWLIFYLLIFFLITYLVIGSLMMAVGSAVNEMREAQSLMTPIMLVLMIPWMLWMPISRDPNSTFSVVISFIPPVNAFAMLLRMASNAPPPLWQAWLSICIGIASVFAALWFAAKVFRIGLLMYGKPPNFATLVRWARLS